MDKKNILSAHFHAIFSSNNNCLTALPGPPTEVRSSEVTATTVRLTWTYNGPEEPQYYVIQYKPKYANQVRCQIFFLKKQL